MKVRVAMAVLFVTTTMFAACSKASDGNGSAAYKDLLVARPWKHKTSVAQYPKDRDNPAPPKMKA